MHTVVTELYHTCSTIDITTLEAHTSRFRPQDKRDTVHVHVDLPLANCAL